MKKNLTVWLGLAAAGLLALGGCHSAPTHLYSLTAEEPVVRINSQTPLLRIDAVHVPPEWDRIELLTPTSAGELNIDDLDHWSAPLAQATRQVLSSDLDARMPPGRVIYPHLPKSASTLGINVDILAFSVVGSRSVMQASWVITPGTEAQAAKRSVAALDSPLANTAPTAIAQSWSALVGQLADRIAADAASFSVSQ